MKFPLCSTVLLFAFGCATHHCTTQIHAHNDYEHTHPLTDALAVHAGSVEADIFLIDGELLVGHTRSNAIKNPRTLKSLYLDPLQQRATANGGWVYKDSHEPLILLIDIKDDASQTYPALRQLLVQYPQLLTTFSRSAGPQERGILVVLTGNQPPRKVLESEEVRLCACDGNLTDLSTDPPPSRDLIPLVSSQWRSSFRWSGLGPFPYDEREKLLGYVALAHAQQRTLRFWGAPGTDAAWGEMCDARVDWLNVDELKQARAFLDAHPCPPATHPSRHPSASTRRTAGEAENSTISP